MFDIILIFIVILTSIAIINIKIWLKYIFEIYNSQLLLQTTLQMYPLQGVATFIGPPVVGEWKTENYQKK